MTLKMQAAVVGQFGAAGKVKADIEPQLLSAINDVLDRLKRGEAPSRVVLEFA
jgi:propanol-preferring alcohol dehydrogenase